MRGSPTKSFDASSCRRANRRSPLGRIAPEKRANPKATREKANLREWVKRCPSALKSVLRKPPKNEKKPDATSATSANLVRPRIRRIRPDLVRRAASRLAFALFLISTAALGAEEDARRLFEIGRTAFQEQNYAAALEAFEAALAAELNGPAVHFNIGVTAYRLQDYDRAERAFREVAREPSMAALAYYNLGLIEQRRGHTERARGWFTRTANESQDERLRELARAQLERVPATPARDWAAYASAGLGYDDNVALVSDSDVLGVSGLEDWFAEAQLAVSTPLSTPMRFDGGLFAIDYMDLNQFDQLGLYGGARYRFSPAGWKHQLAVQLAHSTLDGEGFENRALATAQTQRSLTEDWSLRARYRFSYIDGLNDFESVGGQRHEVSAHVDRSFALWDLGFSYELERSELDDDALSATRHELRMNVERDLMAGWTGEGGVALQRTRYVQGDDEETRTELVVAIARSFGKSWRVIARYARADNRADIPELNYGQNRVVVFVEVLL